LELDCLEFLLRKCGSTDGSSLTIASAFWRPSIPGAIYVEAPTTGDIRRAFAQTHIVYVDREISFVPLPERVQLLEMKTVMTVAEGDWVRTRSGTYKGDIGYVTEVITYSAKVRVFLVPRLSYLERSKDLKRLPETRPLPALFDADRARNIFGTEAVQQGKDWLRFQGMKFKDGFLERRVNVHTLNTKNVRPTFEEIELFNASSGWCKAARHRWKVEDTIASLSVNDRIKIIKGELKGLRGIITSKDVNSVQVHLRKDDNDALNEDQLLEVPAHQIHKSFSVGDYVRVRLGVHAGKSGFIVNMSNDDILQITTASVDSRFDNLEVKALLPCRFSC
jgi:transcription elongation factor SPT5